MSRQTQELDARRPQANAWGLTLLVSAMLAIGWSLTLVLGGADEVGWRRVVRGSARATLLLFLLAFAASALQRRWPSGLARWLLRHRRQLGVAAAVSHGFHLIAVMAVLGPAFALRQPIRLLGAIPYALLFGMAATSTDTAVLRLGARRWRRLHLIGGYLIWAVFFVAYATRTLRDPLHAPLVVLLLAVLALRLLPVASGPGE